MSGLLTVGTDFDKLDAILRDPKLQPVNALLLAENGLPTVYSPGWIARLASQIVLLSVRAGDNRSVLAPGMETFLSNFTLLRTDRNGWVHLSTDGQDLGVEV